MKKAFLCQRSTGMLFDIYNEGRTLFFDSSASQALCAAKPWRRGDSFAPSKCNRRRVSAQRVRTQQSRLLAAVPSGTSIRSVAQNCHRRNSFPPLNDNIGTEVCLAHRRSSKRATTHGSWLFCWTSGVLGTPPFRCYHLTAEMNSAYGNSALRFELTCHLARPPEGGFAGFVPFGRSPFGDCTCSGRMNRPCAKALLRKALETPNCRKKGFALHYKCQKAFLYCVGTGTLFSSLNPPGAG